MTTASEHKRKAEEWLEMSQNSMFTPEEQALMVARAQVHATLSNYHRRAETHGFGPSA